MGNLNDTFMADVKKASKGDVDIMKIDDVSDSKTLSKDSFK